MKKIRQKSVNVEKSGLPNNVAGRLCHNLYREEYLNFRPGFHRTQPRAKVFLMEMSKAPCSKFEKSNQKYNKRGVHGEGELMVCSWMW